MFNMNIDVEKVFVFYFEVCFCIFFDFYEIIKVKDKEDIKDINVFRWLVMIKNFEIYVFD